MNRNSYADSAGIAEKIAVIASAIADSVFPRACPVCGDLLGSEEGLIHKECLNRLSFVHLPACECCGRQIITTGQKLCRDCAANERHFIRNFTTLNYDDTARRITSDLKYHNRRQNAELLGRLMAYKNKEEIENAGIDCIVPVPISEERYRERRYNQAELIADALGGELGMVVLPQILIRKKRTKAMKDLGASDRLTEMKNAITAGEIPKGVKRVLIVDDIYTTGATMEACAYILWSKGIETYAACACIGSDF